MSYARHTLVKPEPLRIGEHVVDLVVLEKTGRKIFGVVSSLCELTVNGVKLACAVVRGPGENPAAADAWVVCDELQRWRRALPSEVAS